MRKRGLGRGLAALLGPAQGGGDLFGGRDTLPIEFLQPSPFQPRRHFDDEQLAALTESIRAQGIMQPLVVRPTASDGRYEIVAGERRWRAAQRAGLHDVPVVVRDLSDVQALEIALIENLQREDLGALDEAHAYQRLIDEFGHTQEALAQAVGRSRSHIANTLRLLALPEPVRHLIRDGSLSAGHARALATAADPVTMARQVVERGLSVRAAEELARSDRPVRKADAKPAQPEANVRALERELSEALGLAVRLHTSGGSGGRMIITYRSNDQLETLIDRLT